MDVQIGFMNVKRGDVVIRLVAQMIPQKMTVIKTDERLIYATAEDAMEREVGASPVWTFDRATGVEEDEEQGWGVLKGITGSQLIGVV